MRLVAQVIGQLDLHRPLHQPLRQLAKQSPRPDDLLRTPSSREQLVNDLIRQLVSHPIRQPIKDPRRGRRSETLARSENFFFCVDVEGMTLQFDHAYTIPRTLPPRR